VETLSPSNSPRMRPADAIPVEYHTVLHSANARSLWAIATIRRGTDVGKTGGGSESTVRAAEEAIAEAGQLIAHSEKVAALVVAARAAVTDFHNAV
jgi:hypothetical protein